MIVERTHNINTFQESSLISQKQTIGYFYSRRLSPCHHSWKAVINFIVCMIVRIKRLVDVLFLCWQLINRVYRKLQINYVHFSCNESSIHFQKGRNGSGGSSKDCLLEFAMKFRIMCEKSLLTWPHQITRFIPTRSKQLGIESWNEWKPTCNPWLRKKNRLVWVRQDTWAIIWSVGI